jgi:hypothetical protein
LDQFASSIRLKNRLTGLKSTEIQADSFLENMDIHRFKEEIGPKEFLLQVGRVCSIAEYLDVPVTQLPDLIEEKERK